MKHNLREALKLSAILVFLFFCLNAAASGAALAEDGTLLSFPANDIAAVMINGKVFPVRMLGIVVAGTSVYQEERIVQGTEGRLKEFLSTAVRKGTKVSLEYDKRKEDLTLPGYLAAYIWLPDGKLLNEEIVLTGFAVPTNEGRYVDRLVKAFNRVH